MRILIPILVLASAFMFFVSFEAQGTISQVTGNPIIDGDIRLNVFQFPAATSEETTAAMKVTQRKVARVQIMNGSETATGTYTTTGTIGGTSFWLEGRLPNSTSTSLVQYVTLALSSPAATPSSATDVMDFYGIYEYDIEGYSYIRVGGIVNAATNNIYVNLVK